MLTDTSLHQSWAGLRCADPASVVLLGTASNPTGCLEEVHTDSSPSEAVLGVARMAAATAGAMAAG